MKHSHCRSRKSRKKIRFFWVNISKKRSGPSSTFEKTKKNGRARQRKTDYKLFRDRQRQRIRYIKTKTKTKNRYTAEYKEI